MTSAPPPANPGASPIAPTSPAGTTCPVCGAVADRVFADDGGRFRVLVCAACDLGITVPQPTDAELGALYAGDYAGESAKKFGGPLEAVRRVFARALARRIVRRLGAGGRVLDVGCGDGKVLVALAAHGFTCSGTELNPHARETVPADVAVDIRHGTLEDARFPDGAFGVVILRHVLEHVRDPLATLREVRRVLAPDGTLVVAVPNRASWQARATRSDWFHLDLPRHLYHFTPRALAGLLARTGFRVAHQSHVSFEQNPFGWLQSAFNRAGGRWRAFYDQLRAPGAAQARARDPVALGVALAITPLCIGLATIESLAGAGGSIEVWARRV